MNITRRILAGVAGAAAAVLLSPGFATSAQAIPTGAAAPSASTPPMKPLVGVAGYNGGPLKDRAAYDTLLKAQGATSLQGAPNADFHWQGAKQVLSTTQNGGTTQLAGLTSQHHPDPDGLSHTLWEMAGISSDSQQILEIGWTMDTPICGQSVNPCLFVYSWVAGVPQGYNGYNPGWVDNPNEAVNAGTALASTATGSAPTLFYQYRMERITNPTWCTGTCGSPSGFGTGWQFIQKNQGATDRIIGGFRDTHFSGVSGGFTKFDYFEIYGEEATQGGGAIACGDGGSGVFGTSTEPSAAARTVAYSFAAVAGKTNVPDEIYVKDSYDPSVTSPDTPTAYRIYQLPTDLDQWKWGGPGYNSAGTGTGTIGGC